MLTREQILGVVALAGRAPSPHNIQPARWRFSGDRVELLEEPTRWLSVGDSTGRDNQVALGMAWEGTTIALSRHGLGIAGFERKAHGYPSPSSTARLAASGRVVQGRAADPLLAQIERRASWRGTFERLDPPRLAELDACIARHADVAVPVPEPLRVDIARWYDAAAVEGLDDQAFAAELYRWMRFSSRHGAWERDGLTADCMALSALQAWGASVMLRPPVVRVLGALSLTRFLVSEAAKTGSAARIVMMHAPAGAPVFDAGRAWYRFWLELARGGYAGVPMSALADSSAYSARLLGAAPLPPGRKLINVMRVGRAPAATPRSARLPTAELLLE